MKKFLKPIICLFVMIMIIIPSSLTVFAKDQRVFDDAKLLKSSDVQNLENEIKSLSKKYNQDIVIVTTNDTKGKTSRAYADDYFDYNKFGEGKKKSGFLFLIDMKNRQVYISTKGSAKRILSDKEREAVLDKMMNYISQKNYNSASKVFLDQIEIQMDKAVKKITPIELLVIIGITGVFFAVFVFAVKKKYGTEGKACPYPFNEKGNVNLTRSDDIFEREYVTQTQISSSSDGGSSTHTSSSGDSHGGGGRSF